MFSCGPTSTALSPAQRRITESSTRKATGSVFSPKGAAFNSQGRQPLEAMHANTSLSPEGAALNAAPSGLIPAIGPRARGSRPWLLNAAPSGLKNEHVAFFVLDSVVTW